MKCIFMMFFFLILCARSLFKIFHIVFIITLNSRILALLILPITHTVINSKRLKTIMDKVSCRVAKGQSGLTGQPAWPGQGLPTRQEAGGSRLSHHACIHQQLYGIISCLSLVNSVCALTDHSVALSQIGSYIWPMCVIGSIRSASILVLKGYKNYMYIQCKQHA